MTVRENVMAKSESATGQKTASDQSGKRSGNASGSEAIKRESSAQYQNSIEKINRAQDRDIAKALRN